MNFIADQASLVEIVLDIVPAIRARTALGCRTVWRVCWDIADSRRYPRTFVAVAADFAGSAGVEEGENEAELADRKAPGRMAALLHTAVPDDVMALGDGMTCGLQIALGVG